MNRRDSLKLLTAAALSAGGGVRRTCAADTAPRLTPPEEIQRRVDQARPMRGGPIPADLKDRLGASHYDGRYFLTKEPYLIEGCKALERLGMRVAKFWFGPSLPGYNYNSDWKLSPKARLIDVARHPYFVEAFGRPMSTFVLEIAPVASGKGLFDPQNDFASDEEQFHELAAHFLATYRDRAVTFILQHWEGDWMLRSGAGQTWRRGGPPDVQQRCDGFARWLAARQRGVERARAEAGNAKCRVLHAAEVNRVWDSTQGIPTLTSHVLPHVALDLVSWSSYDGTGSALRTWQGIELIRHYARPSPVFGRPMVYIGEVGLPEHGKSQQEVVDWWDRTMGVFLALEMPWILHWELYCNEPLDSSRRRGNRDVLGADALRGFWLLRPDGSLSHSGKYLKGLLDRAGELTDRAAAC